MSYGRILVAEDDDALRETLAEIFKLEGYVVEEASDGWQALVAAIRTPPSLVLLDMRMPILNGWEFARELEARGLDVPIVVMTAAEAASEVAEEIDAEDWVGKPFNLEELLSAVRTALASRSSA
jgi:DNA-binding response OmpR family regulator